MKSDKQRVLVTGGGTFLGDNIAAALLAGGAEVTLLIRRDAENRLGPLAQRTRWHFADVWDPASLRGRARGHNSVIHTIGSMVADPSQGLSHNRLNFVSARNAANMCVSDGVQNFILMSSVSAPWINRQYIRAKREAESYMARVGLQATIIRAPIAYIPGRPRPLFYQFMSLLGKIPPLSWIYFGRIAPIPIDVLSRGVAHIALNSKMEKQIYYASDLKKFSKLTEAKLPAKKIEDLTTKDENQPHPFELIDEEIPFGWTPPDHE